MSGMNGSDLMARLSRLQPAMKCLYVSGYTANIIAVQGGIGEGTFLLQKPFSQKELAAKVHLVLSGGFKAD